MGTDVEMTIDRVVDRLAKKAVEDGLSPELLRESAFHFFSDIYNITKEKEAAKKCIEEIAYKLEKRMIEMGAK